jgi:hypothetical protein
VFVGEEGIVLFRVPRGYEPGREVRVSVKICLATIPSKKVCGFCKAFSPIFSLPFSLVLPPTHLTRKGRERRRKGGIKKGGVGGRREGRGKGLCTYHTTR